MSSKWGWVTLSVAVAAGLAMFADSTLAQQPFGELDIVTLATREPVQKELELGSDVKEKLSAIANEYRNELLERMSSMGGFQNLSDEERQIRTTKTREIVIKLNAKYHPKVISALNLDKFKRLQQISWQAPGAAAYTFNDPEVVKALDLSKEQQEKISSVNQEFDKKLFAILGNRNFQELFAKMREISQERNETVEEVLSKDQQAKFKELKGKEFDLAQLRKAPGEGHKGKAKDAKN